MLTHDDLKSIQGVLDTSLKGLILDISVLKSDVSELKLDMSTLKNDVGVLTEEVSVLKSGYKDVLTKIEITNLKLDIQTRKLDLTNKTIETNMEELVCLINKGFTAQESRHMDNALRINRLEKTFGNNTN